MKITLSDFSWLKPSTKFGNRLRFSVTLSNIINTELHGVKILGWQAWKNSKGLYIKGPSLRRGQYGWMSLVEIFPDTEEKIKQTILSCPEFTNYLEDPNDAALQEMLTIMNKTAPEKVEL